MEKDIHEGFKENWTRDSTCSLYVCIVDVVVEIAQLVFFSFQNYTEQPGLQPHIKLVYNTFMFFFYVGFKVAPNCGVNKFAEDNTSATAARDVEQTRKQPGC